MSLALASLHVYPIKSLGGFAVHEASLTDRGLLHDRRWMLLDTTGRFVSQRDSPVLACLHCTALSEGFRVTDVRDGSSVDLPWELDHGEEVKATVWSDQVALLLAAEAWSAWFSERVSRPVRLAYMPDASVRNTDRAFAEGITSLSDGFPYLIISQASLDTLNARLAQPLPMDRFRPNIVITGGEAFQEDTWSAVTIGGTSFRLVKPCARCVITTTDQHTGLRGQEPLRTLATFRQQENKVLFGMNAMSERIGSLRVGDGVEVTVA